MARMSIARMDSAKNGYAGMNSICTIALTERTKTPVQRANWFFAKTPNAIRTWATPKHSKIQPQVLRLENTYSVLCTKNLESSIAARPYMELSDPTTISRMPANTIQP